VGPRAVQDAVVKRKIPSPRWESNPRNRIVQPVAHKRKRKYNIKMNLQERGYDDMNYIEVTQDMVQGWALINTVINLRIP
jgi:hypothetical protein